MRGSKLATAVAVTVAVFGLGVAAFALDGTGTEDPLADPSTTTVVPTTVAPGPDAGDPETVTDPAGEDDPPTVSTVDCPEGTSYRNHGAYVSSVARDPDRAPGDVPTAAHSDCGKPLADGASEPTDTTEPADTTDPADSLLPTDDGALPGTPKGGPAGGPPASPGHSGAAPGHDG